MELLNIQTLPRYTQYEISSLVNEKINNSNVSPTVFASHHSVSLDVLNEILEGNTIFRMKHYEVAGNILDLTLDDLLKEDSCDSEAYFRTNEYGEEVEEFVNKVSSLFKEWVYQKKISGDIN